MALEPAIAGLVNDFIAAGRPSSRSQTFAQRRAGYIASTVLAGDIEPRAEVEDVVIDGISLRILSPLNTEGALPAVIYYHGGCLSAVDLPHMKISCVSLLITVAAG